MFFAATVLALLIERIIGYPSALARSIGHPVEWIGNLIARLDERLNPEARPGKSGSGVIALVILLVVTGGPALALALLLRQWTYGWIVEAFIATPLLAQRSLRDHVRAVAEGLDSSLDAGRKAV